MVYLTTERQDLFDVGMMIAIRIDVSGRASEEQIRDAFDRAVRSHEILGMHIVIGEDGRAWYEQGRSAQSLSFTDKTQEDIIYREERRRFRLEDGELLRAFCMGLTADGFSMLFCMHHLGGDGKSLLYFAETFLKALNGEEPEHTPMRWLDLGSLPKDSYLPFLGKMLVDSYNRRWSKQRQIFSFDDMDRAYDTFWSTHRTYIHEISYDRDETKELVSQAKSCDVSFTA
ncbi:MAG: hypothetical protein IKR73_08535, partial [Oscillospiraceae bacterium]|nr:hypothetical protein [Oscillospiraceae bacterium]